MLPFGKHDKKSRNKVKIKHSQKHCTLHSQRGNGKVKKRGRESNIHREQTKYVQHIFSHGIIIFVGEQTNEPAEEKIQLNCIKLNIIVRKNRISNANK